MASSTDQSSLFRDLCQKEKIVVLPLSDGPKFSLTGIFTGNKYQKDLEMGAAEILHVRDCPVTPLFKRLFSLLYRIYLGSLLMLLIVTCSYGILSFGLDIMSGGRIAHCGSFRKYQTDTNSTAFDFISVVRVEDRSLLNELQTMRGDFVLMDIWGDVPDRSGALVKLTLQFVGVPSIKERVSPDVVRPPIALRRRRSVEPGFSLDELAAYQDDYSVNVDLEMDKELSDDDEAELDLFSTETNVTNPSDNIYEEKCKEWTLQKQQKELFSAARLEVTNIRKKMEEALRGASMSRAELDVQNPRVQGVSKASSDRLRAQKTIYDILKQYNGALESRSGIDRDLISSSNGGVPVWARNWDQ